MPPEAIKNKDSGKLRDLWSLGCTIYQILTGNPPFSGSTDYFILLRVEAGALEFPPDFDPLARDLVERLLVAEPEKRLGANGFHEIKSHPFFNPECFDTPALLGRIYPSLQELCIRKVLKRFHTLLLDAMDKKRQGKPSHEQPSRAKLSDGEEEDSVERSETHDSCGVGLKEDSVVRSSSSSSCSNDAELEEQEVESCSRWPSSGIGFEVAQRLLDQVVPRELREQPKSEMSPHLQILIGRLEYFLHSQDRQFSKECSLADEWGRKHSLQCNSSDAESGDEAHHGGHPNDGTGS